MTTSIVNFLRGCLSFSLLVINTLFWFLFLLPLSFLKLIIPAAGWRNLCNKGLDFIGTNWIAMNNLNFAVTNNIEWRVSGLDQVDTRDWCLVLSNHQSWSDILVLQKVFNKKAPFLKFFIKQELIWVPVMGLAWWALDYPFMKRYTKEQIEKNPELKGKDLETTRLACQKFRHQPVSVMNFAEGTRYTPEKSEKQESPYQHLLRPKAAGTGFVLSAMGDCLRKIVNVTIVYPGGVEGLWGFISGRVREVRVKIETMPVTDDLLGDYFEDKEFQARFQAWLNELWAEKDALYGRMLAEESGW